ncbi:hypothetical protein EIP91_001582 [Steccherinum ochraceum]|uniref:Uncharacterized protein n=1 Tax=Steccherinum ochraceum TaxID=92696 RepID=A0A4R0RDW0_9APHY|nr:hypothetical protein EIP91_001582 [Steccherinum ochraceum]
MTRVNFLLHSSINTLYRLDRVDLSASLKSLDDARTTLASHIRIFFKDGNPGGLHEQFLCFYVPNPPMLANGQLERTAGYPYPSANIADKFDASRPLTDLPKLDDDDYVHVIIAVHPS